MKTKFLLLAALAVLTMNISCSDDDKLPVQTPDDTEQKPDPEQKPDEVDKDKDTTGPYKVGDYYKSGKIAGIVYSTKPDGMHGVIVSLEEGSDMQWSTESFVAGTPNKYNGEDNMTIVKTISDWENLLPVYKWCDGLNQGGAEGWYIPSIVELQGLYSVFEGIGTANQWNGAARKAFNSALKKYGGTIISETEYWSSSECTDIATSWMSFLDQSTACGLKASKAKVRAIRNF